MYTYEDYIPNTEEERLLFEYLDDLASSISGKIRGINEKYRLSALKDLNPSELALMKIYLQALKIEDYETCAVTRVLLLERGFEIPN